MLLVIYFLLFSFVRIAATTLDTIALGQFIRDGQIVVSAGEVFEMGFFSPGKLRSRYLGIWYKRDTTDRSVVWVANRDTPISDSSGVLSISGEGILVLMVNSSNDIVWSSSKASRAPQNPVAVLLDSGNLVLKDDHDDNDNNNPDKFLWQSFDYPSDTLLPRMKIGRNFVTGLDSFLSSWKSADDPSQGDFTLWIDPEGFPQMVLKMGNSTQIRLGSWNGLHFTGLPQLKPNPDNTLVFVLNEKEVYHKYEIRNSSLLVRLVLDPFGIVERFTWRYRTSSWAQINAVVLDGCDNYALCGSNAGCNISNTPQCECLTGFVPKSLGEWNQLDWSGGCVRRMPLNCKNGDGFLKYEAVKLPDTLNCKNGDGFLKYEAVKLPDTSYVWFNKSISLIECKKSCSNNCSCIAYASLDVREGGSGCLLWFRDLIDIRELAEGGQDLYIRMAVSELDNIEARRHPNKKKQVIIIVTCIISAIFGVLVFGWIVYMWKKKLRSQGSRKDDTELPIYDLNSVADATNNFSNKNMLGEGGFGPVYKGTLMDGQEIAVKRLSKCSGQGMEEFKNEVVLIAKLQHRNLVKLLGCCTEKDERMLIYEYMPNQSLDYFIFDITRREILDWSKCIQIIRGIARGLLYLHQDSRLRIIHRDLKASNVLLDNDMNPKISDFGLARSFGGDQTEAETNRVVGTYGYMSPEYTIDGIFSVKSDVYSFGVLVLEIISGKRNRGFCHSDHNLNLLGHAWRLWNEERAVELIDKSLDYSAASSEILRYIHVGLLCVQQGPEDRPNMSTVVLMLGSEGSLPQPKQPGFFSERNMPESDSSSSKHLSSSTNEVTISLLQPR
ncbi:hypothetical protein Dsin_022785 [Dipteronia sinensis]|uniref:Receptor-like serine/threonine-protein kinase n=1 Tax=Dipteronia sinensis TaxID=43782 RepID=A0AAE0A2L1_9ROSI|nr:hypothetical protein Dsin_022785 [Dipteronia sinensis]